MASSRGTWRGGTELEIRARRRFSQAVELVDSMGWLKGGRFAPLFPSHRLLEVLSGLKCDPHRHHYPNLPSVAQTAATPSPWEIECVSIVLVIAALVRGRSARSSGAKLGALAPRRR